MNTFTRISSATIVCHCVAALALGAPAAATEADARPIPVVDYTVFVDPPTGFVFVKLPAGWKFAGQITEAQVASLPNTVVTSLLTRDTAPASAVPAPAESAAATAHVPAIAHRR